MSYEEEFQAFMKRNISKVNLKIIETSDMYFCRLAKEFPLTGSKVDWDNIPNSIFKVSSNVNDVSPWCEFFKNIVKRNKLTGNVLYMNDAAFDCAYIFPIEVALNHIAEILEFPEHHYFINEDFKWCFSFTMEGEMAFGFNPKLSNI